jgi:signal peptidase II
VESASSLKATDSSLPIVVPRSRYVVFFGIAVLGCALDLLTKHWVFQWRGMPVQSPVWWLWEPYVGVETALNRGALFGMGSGFGTGFAILSIVAAVGIVVWLFCFQAARDRLLTVALGCVMGGIGGNLYDRLGLWQVPGAPGVFRNEVRDWILLRYHEFTWPNFNVADSLLVFGAGLLLWHGLRFESPRQDAETDASEASSA